MPQKGQTQAQALAIAAEREAEAVKLYTSGGHTYLQVAQTLGYSNESAAKKAIDRALRKRFQETTEHRDALIQRHLEITREAIASLAPRVRKGDVRSIEVLIQILNREARLLGLDATVRVDVKVTDAMMAEVEELVEQMANLDAQAAQQALAKERG